MQGTPVFHRYSKVLAACGLASLLAGCSTFSFAPPRVEVDRQIANPDPSKCAQLAGMDQPKIPPNVVGAIALTDNFVRAYRCAAHEAADGRQIFEVPSMLALVTAAIGPSFGLDDDGRIAAVASAALYGRANSYYAPKEKAKLLDTALDAVLCIKTTSVDVSFFDTTAKPNTETAALIKELRGMLLELNGQLNRLGEEKALLQRATEKVDQKIAALERQEDTPERRRAIAEMRAARQAVTDRLAQMEPVMADTARRVSDLDAQLARLQRAGAIDVASPLVITRTLADGAKAEIDVPRQYFEMVSAALFSVERVLAQRLSDAGAMDTAGIASQFSDFAKQADDAKRKKAALLNMDTDGDRMLTLADRTPEVNSQMIELDIEELQPRLQTCVVRAKL